MKCVLLTFKDNLFADNHVVILFSSLDSLFYIEFVYHDGSKTNLYRP